MQERDDDNDNGNDNASHCSDNKNKNHSIKAPVFDANTQQSIVQKYARNLAEENKEDLGMQSVRCRTQDAK